MIQSVQITRCFGKSFGGFQNASSIFTAYCQRGYHQGRPAPCFSSFLSYSTNVPSVYGFRKLNATVQTCSILPAVLKRHCYAGSDYPYEYDNDKYPHLTQFKSYGRPADAAPVINRLFQCSPFVEPMLDETFSTEKFLWASRKMVEMVSSRIAKGDFNGLYGLVTPDVIEEIKLNLPKFSKKQRRDLAVNDEELVYSFLDMFNYAEDPEARTISLEILTIHHAHKGIDKIKRLAGHFHLFNEETKMEILQGCLTRVYILNYRFVRTYYIDSDTLDDWIVDAVQHLAGHS